MARRRKLSPERKEFINGLLEHYQPNHAHYIQVMINELLGDTLQQKVLAGMVFRSFFTNMGNRSAYASTSFYWY